MDCLAQSVDGKLDAAEWWFGSQELDGELRYAEAGIRGSGPPQKAVRTKEKKEKAPGSESYKCEDIMEGETAVQPPLEAAITLSVLVR